jgi:pimeloyl-ACP methyl ester carboxylesterase
MRSFTYKGHRLVGHSGGVSGYRSTMMFDPATKTGVVMLWNSDANLPFRFQAEFFDRAYGLPFTDWLDLAWGSALAVTHRQDANRSLFHAYVGTAQLISYADDVKLSYARTLGLARAAGDAETVDKLEKLGPPPWTNPRAFGTLRRATRKYEALKTDPAPAGWLKPATGYDTPAYEAAYEAGEDYSFVQFVGLAGDGMGPRIDLAKLGTRFEMPVYLLQGEEDLVTPPEISRAYFDSLTAPAKAFISLPRTGHDPNRAMIDGQLQVLETRVRAAAIAADKR